MNLKHEWRIQANMILQSRRIDGKAEWNGYVTSMMAENHEFAKTYIIYIKIKLRT